MDSNNFICYNCEKTFFVPRYSQKIVDGQRVLQKDYQCYHCKSDDTGLVPAPKKVYTADTTPVIGKFSSASDEGKKLILQKRANEHYNKKGKQEKRERFKTAMRNMEK